MYDRIVIATDGSDGARRAARRGLQFAHAFDAAVHVVAVVERRPRPLTGTATEEARVRARGMEALEEVERRASDLGRPVSTQLAEGRPAVRIGRIADERDADLIVVGRRESTGLGRRLLGGVTERLLHRCAVPVLVVPSRDRDDGADTAWARVLVTTDGSDPAQEAIPHAVAIARACGATVHVLNVVDVQAAGGVFGAGGLEAEFLERLDEQGRRAVDEAAARIGAGAPDLCVETAVERTTSFEGAAAGIRAYVDEHGIDLVVTSSHGRSGVGRGVVGSVASAVLRTVDVPVLVVRRS